MSFKDLTHPDTLAASLDDLKNHLRIDGTLEDAYLQTLLRTATRLVEGFADVRLISRQVRYTCAYSGTIWLPIGPLVHLNGLEVQNMDGTFSAVEHTQAIVHTDEGRVDVTPCVAGLAPKRLRLTCTVGHGLLQSDVPAPLAHAVVMQAAFMYEARGLVDAVCVSETVAHMCRPYKRLRAA